MTKDLEEKFNKEIPLRELNADNPQYVLGWNMARELCKEFLEKAIRGQNLEWLLIIDEALEKLRQRG